MASSGQGLLLLLVVVALSASALAAVSYRGHALFRLSAAEERQAAAVRQLLRWPGLELWSRARLDHGPGGRPLVVRVPPQLRPAFRRHLDRHRVPHQMVVADLEEVVQKEREQMLASRGPSSADSRITFTEYHRYDEIRQYLSDLAAAYPSTVTVRTIGQTFEGRPLDMIQVSSGGGGSRPVILVDAGIHAREWIAPAAALYVIHQLVENATQSDLTDAVDWHIIPVLNPDGYEYSLTGARYWRKTRSNTSIEGCEGVDGNRNFDFHWMEVGASSYPCEEDYAGPEPFSEPETRALRDYVLANAGRVKLYLTFHTCAQAFLYPWGYTSELPDDWETLDALARRANAAQRAAGGPEYDVGSSTNELGAAAGGSDDWTKAVGGVNLSYTIELTGGDWCFDPPAAEIASFVTPFFEAVRVFGQYVADNYS